LKMLSEDKRTTDQLMDRPADTSVR
jgi:hypothetical protein